MNNNCCCHCCCCCHNSNTPTSAIVAIKNCGCFKAEFYISYCLNGQAYNYDSGVFHHGSCRAIKIPINAYNICLTIKIFHKGACRTILSRCICRRHNLCFILSGTMCKPCCRRIPCRCLC